MVVPMAVQADRANLRIRLTTVFLIDAIEMTSRADRIVVVHGPVVRYTGFLELSNEPMGQFHQMMDVDMNRCQKFHLEPERIGIGRRGVAPQSVRGLIELLPMDPVSTSGPQENRTNSFGQQAVAEIAYVGSVPPPASWWIRRKTGRWSARHPSSRCPEIDRVFGIRLPAFCVSLRAAVREPSRRKTSAPRANRLRIQRLSSPGERVVRSCWIGV